MADETGFILHPPLEQGTAQVADLALDRVLLMDDARFPWLILVPRRPDLGEIIDLSQADRAQLIEEIAMASTALKGLVPCDKINVGALGNNTPQLHIHVVARTRDDAAWPGPVWGVKGAESYGAALPSRAAALARALDEVRL